MSPAGRKPSPDQMANLFWRMMEGTNPRRLPPASPPSAPYPVVPGWWDVESPRRPTPDPVRSGRIWLEPPAPEPVVEPEPVEALPAPEPEPDPDPEPGAPAPAKRKSRFQTLEL